MGNTLTKVQTKSAPIVNDPPWLPPPVPVESSASVTPPEITAEQPAKDVKLPNFNPGSLDELHRSYTDITPNVFDGIKIAVNKGLSQNFQVSHTMCINEGPTNGYRFGATYVGDKRAGQTDVSPVLFADTDSKANVNGQLIHQIGPLRARLITQIRKSNAEVFQSGLEYFGKNFTTSLMLINPNVVHSSGVMVLSHLQKFSENVTLGLEFQSNQMANAKRMTTMGLIGRYANEKWSAAAQFNMSGVHFTYYRKASSQLQVGVELVNDLRNLTTVSTLAMQFDFPKDNFTFRTSINSNWSIAALIEKKCLPLPYTLQMSARLNHVPSRLTANNVSVGVGINVGG